VLVNKVQGIRRNQGGAVETLHGNKVGNGRKGDSSPNTANVLHATGVVEGEKHPGNVLHNCADKKCYYHRYKNPRYHSQRLGRVDVAT